MSTWPEYSQEEREAVNQVLSSGNVNYWNGDEGRSFEAEFAGYHNMPFGVAVANGTLALELALKSLGIGQGDDVIVTPRTFMASASSIVMVGARPIFAEVDPASQNITPDTVRAVMTPRTKAIMVVHLAGWPCDMPEFQDLAAQHSLYLIEDCAQAHGATIDGQRVGSFGDAAAFSFCTDKIMTTGGEGGMVLFKDEKAWRHAWSYKDHGKDWDAVYNRVHPPGFRWLHESFGTNWRLTEMQSAIGRLQLRKLSAWVAKRQTNASILNEMLSTEKLLRVTAPPDRIGHAYYKYYVFIRPEQLKPGWNRDRIVQSMQDEDIPCMQGSCSEVYLEKAFEKTSFRPEKRLSVAQELGETSILFPVHPTLTETNMIHFAAVAREVLNLATSSR